MSKEGPLVIVEDDKEVIAFYRTAFDELKVGNALRFFENAPDAFYFLETTREDPFLIICDIHMDGMSGLEFREKIHANPYLRNKATPFVFRTGTPTIKDIVRSNDLTVQGFFRKKKESKESIDQLDLIVRYWKECLDPGDTV